MSSGPDGGIAYLLPVWAVMRWLTGHRFKRYGVVAIVETERRALLSRSKQSWTGWDLLR
jgi:hypothetical protein